MLAIVRRFVQRKKIYYIVVMGPTGVGKTSFINTASGSDLRVGRGLESETDRVQFSKPINLGDDEVTLVDTPGFDDTTIPEAETLTTIAEFLKRSYLNREVLLGVVYLHRISDNRMGGTALRNFKMFRELCGPTALSNCVIGLSMWDEVSEEIRSARFQELCSKEIFFKPAIDAGAQALPYRSTRESALDLLQRLVKKQPKTLLIQYELVEERKLLRDTGAGIALLGDLAEKQRKQQEQLLEMRRELEEAIKQNNEEDIKELEEARSDVERINEHLVTQQKTLRERGVSADGASDAHADINANLSRWRRPLSKIGLMAKALLGMRHS